MVYCKYCNDKIEWKKENDRWVPLDYDTKLRHTCIRKNDIKTNKIYCMDCVKLMKLMKNESIDLTVTSPPYDELRDYKGYDFNFKAIANELFRITKKGGVIVWVVNDATVKGSESGSSFKQALYFKEIGFNLHDTMIYLKSTFSMPSSNRYHQVFEYMFILSKGKPKTFNPIKDRKVKYKSTLSNASNRKKDGNMKDLGKKVFYNEYGNRFNVWKLKTSAQEHPCQSIEHPATFPEKLANDHIISWSNKGEVVFDLMCGSGTTCKMAYLNGRKYIGCDISKEYCDIANKRVKQVK